MAAKRISLKGQATNIQAQFLATGADFRAETVDGNVKVDIVAVNYQNITTTNVSLKSKSGDVILFMPTNFTGSFTLSATNPKRPVNATGPDVSISSTSSSGFLSGTKSVKNGNGVVGGGGGGQIALIEMGTERGVAELQF
ncbi:hypothetical protein HK102_006645, partial [Quaeritorhiza haematococci]